MSIEYVRAVLELSEPIGLARLLLIAIAEHADRNGLAEPGNDCLADETKISERQIRRMLHQMEAQGLLQTVSRGNGRGHRRVIRLAFAPASLTKRGTTAIIKGDTICHPLPAQKGDIDTIKGDKRGTWETERGTTATIKGDTAPEKTADNPINPINQEPIGGDLDQDLLPPAREATTPPPPTFKKSPNQIPAKVYPLLKKPPVRIQSPYLTDARRFVEGYIPEGQGLNPVEVYYERFSINADRERLSAPMEDDLVRNCPELDRLREVITAYGRRKNYAPGNLQLIFDWYRKGVPEYAGGKAPERSRDESGYDFSSYQPQLIA